MSVRIAFIVGIFPAASETFITGQIAGLIERGADVSVYSFRRGDPTFAAAAYSDFDMSSRTTYLDFPERWPVRAVVALKAAFRLLLRNPAALLRALNYFHYGADAWSLKLLCWAGQLDGIKADVIHCHFATVADHFRVIREVLGLQQPWLASFYGYDVSQVPRQKGRDIYRELAASCPKFLVMSEDMKRRVVALGFDEEKITVHPVGIDTRAYQYRGRFRHDGPVRLSVVARLVEKKGIDDLIRALAAARRRIDSQVNCTVIGDGPLRESLHALARQQHVDDIIEWRGFMRQEDMIRELESADIYLQPSKTSSTGDME